MSHQNISKLWKNSRSFKAVTICIILSLVVILSYDSSYKLMKNNLLTDPNLLTEDSDYINVCVVLQGLNDPTEQGYKLRQVFKRFMKSLILHTRRFPIKLIFLTDFHSVFQIQYMVENLMPPFPLENQLKSGKIVPRFDIHYVEIDPILKDLEPETMIMQKYFNNGGTELSLSSNNPDEKPGSFYKLEYGSQYNKTLHYLSPFYHRIFPNLDRLIVMDADTDFRLDPAVLAGIFNLFSDSELFGCVNEQSPHYHTMLSISGYLKNHPGSELGSPGRFQGLNTGVLLLKLDKLRSSSSFEMYLSASGTSHLAGKYGFNFTHRGAQDWYTLISFENPDLVYILPCKFNRQMNLDYEKPPWLETFWSYHHCPSSERPEMYNVFDKSNAAIIQTNGQDLTFDDYTNRISSFI